MSDNQFPLHLDVARSDSRIADMILFSSATHLEQTVSVLSAPESQSPALHPPASWVSTTTSMRRFSGANVNNVWTLFIAHQCAVQLATSLPNMFQDECLEAVDFPSYWRREKWDQAC